MDARALLTSQGWRGDGHSLHATSDDTGLKRPLLVSQKQNVLGIGKKQHRTSDMWWMNAFDKSLKGLDTSKEGQVVQTITNGGLDMVAKGGGKYVGTGGLYSCFVRGTGLNGTLTPEDTPSSSESGRTRKHRKGNSETKEERRARKEAKRAAKLVKSSSSDEKAVAPDDAETREQRKERRKQEKLASARKAEKLKKK